MKNSIWFDLTKFSNGRLFDLNDYVQSFYKEDIDYEMYRAIDERFVLVIKNSKMLEDEDLNNILKELQLI